MKTIKRLIVLIVCFVLLSNCFSFNVSAVEDDYYEAVFPLPEDLIDLGFELDEDGNYVYYGDDDPFDLGVSFNFTSEKNSPDFNPMNLPWSSMPDYVQSIINMRLSSYIPSENNTSIPLVLLRVRPTLVEVYVGVNVFLGRLNNSSGSFNLFTVNNTSVLYNSSSCYWAIYDHSGNLYQDWSECSKIKYGDLNSIYQLQSYFLGNMDSGALDYYCWGGNAVKYDVTSVAFLCSSTDSDLNISTYQRSSGFASGSYLPLQDNYPFQYFSYFEPPTKEDLELQLQQEQNETSKGIWETLKELPSKVADSLSGLFTTLKNYILYLGPDDISEEGYKRKFTNVFSDVTSFINDQIEDTEDFKASLDDTFENISGYIETGSNIINKLLNGVPILNTVLIFVVAFAVIRKVVGR